MRLRWLERRRRADNITTAPASLEGSQQTPLPPKRSETLPVKTLPAPSGFRRSFEKDEKENATTPAVILDVKKTKTGEDETPDLRRLIDAAMSFAKWDKLIRENPTFVESEMVLKFLEAAAEELGNAAVDLFLPIEEDRQ